MKPLKPILRLLLFLAMPIIVPREGAPLEIKQSDAEIQAQNAHFRVFFAKDGGGALRALYGKDGARLLSDSHVYTDTGVNEARFYVGSRYEAGPRMKCEKHDGKLEYECEGVLRTMPGEKRSAGTLRYRMKYVLDDTNAIQISWGVMPEFDKEMESGFLAYTALAHEFVQWFANTQDGLVCERASGSPERSFQSAVEPLSLTDPRVGAITAKGRVLVFEGFKSNVPIQSIFFHEGKGTASFFIAILDGPTNLRLEKGKWWQVEFTLRLLDSLAQMTKR